MPPRIVTSNQELYACYHELEQGDIVLGRIRLAGAQEHLLLDLVSRGIQLIPSASSQLCSRSKVYQAALLCEFMVAETIAVYSVHDMIEAVTRYGRVKVESVVCKLDRANAGQGILRFASIEDVYTQVQLGTIPFPFVIQPFVPDCRDVRVILLGDDIEAYQRYNPYNFRHNLHCGGESLSWQLSNEQLHFCHRVMERADFPHAHLDLLILPDESWKLSEINLRGGMRGAVMNQKDYLEKSAAVRAACLEKCSAFHPVIR